MMNDNIKSGKKYWRSLDQIKDTPEFREFLRREFPQGASEMDNSWSRRHFIQLMGASLALAGLASCRRPVEKVVPYVIQPEEVTPGVPTYYATTMPLGMSAHGILVKSNEGRPTKIEGNKEHPTGRGGTNIWHQAAILGLYDPDRSKGVMHKGAEASWDDFVTFWRERMTQFQTNGGSGLAVISESFNSPTLARLKAEMQKKLPLMTWVTYEPISDENIYAGVRAATGRVLQPVFHLDRAKVILSLDSDFLQTESENAVAMLGFAEGRRVMSTKDDMNRLYVVESAHTVTGGMADHRLRYRSCEIPVFALALARELASQGLKLDSLKSIPGNIPPSVDSKWLSAVARDLIRAEGNGLILAGRRQPKAVHALVLALNDALGNVGSTVTYHELPDASCPDRQELAKATQTIQSGS
ncbi:MAG TPA: TAT-variant-translocated molybdopterin oxidoreductase, partial [Candidatus Acidoferrum sp.]|nr:TAT-variant-translocated molybdopterin oxidoreductase [Candidatus Acidoferrum sp.]